MNAQITEFSADDFRKVGAIAEFNPEWMDRPSDKPLLGKPVRVVKVNPKTVMIQMEDGARITTYPFMLIPTDKTFTEDTAPRPVLGSIVRLKNVRNGDGLWVVIDAKVGKFKVAKLGGNDNRYLGPIPTSHVEVVDPADVLR